MAKKVIGIGLLVILFLSMFFYIMFPDGIPFSIRGPSYPEFYFSSIEEFLMFFEKNTQTGEILAVEKNKEEISAAYTAFVSQMVMEPVIYLPTQNQERIPLEKIRGNYNIHLMTKATYELPWIRYFLLGENGSVIMELLHLNESVNEMINQKVAEDRKLKEKEIVLSDRTVSAFIKEQDGRVEILFPYDEIYVSLWAKTDAITDQWLKELGFSKYTSKQWFEETADDIVCSNEAFLDLQSNMVKTVGYYNLFACRCRLGSETGFVYKDDLTYEFIKLLKEEPLYETTSKECHDYGNRVFEIVLKNGEKRTLSFVRDELQYNGHTYTGFSHDFLGRFIELFDL